MSDAAQKVLTDHAVSHVEFVGTDEYVVCLCGERFNDPQSAYSDDNRISHPQHQLAVLSETHAVVELPEPDDVSEWGSVWALDPVIETVQVRPDGSCEIRGDYEYTYTATQLATAGAILIAAARVAEAAR